MPHMIRLIITYLMNKCNNTYIIIYQVCRLIKENFLYNRYGVNQSGPYGYNKVSVLSCKPVVKYNKTC